MAKPVRILHLEDDRSDAELVQSMLAAEGIACDVTLVQTRDEFFSSLDRGKFDLIISDYTLPSFDGKAALAIAREKCPDVPFIFVSGTIGENAAIESLLSGATDYVLKHQLSRLVPAVRRVLHEAEERKERRRAEEALQAAESMFRSLVEQSLVGVYIIQDGKFVYVNPRLAEIFGYSQEEIISSKSVPDLVAQQDRQLVAGNIRRRVEGEEQSIHYTFHGLRKDGTVIDVEVYGTRTEFQGKPAVIGTLLDITERTRAERALRASEEKYRTLIESMNEGVLLVDDHDVIQFVNDELCKMLGYEREEILGKIAHKLFLSERNQEIMKEKNRLRTEGISERYEMEMITNSGDHIIARVSAAPIYDPSGIVVGSLATIANITEQKQAEAQIQEQAALLDITQDAIIVRDLEHRILFWNKGSERLYGLTREEAIGKSVRELLYMGSPHQFDEAMKLLPHKGEWRGELHQEMTDGRTIIVESRWSLVRDREGKPKSILVVNTDITEKKKIEAQFLRAQRMESIGTLAGGIAHDLNNVLAPILMSVQILRTRVSDERSQRMLDTLETSAKRGSDVVKQVLTFARGVEGEKVVFQPTHLIREMEKIIRETFPKTILVRTDTAQDLWSVLGDATHLHQVLMNLCVNARDAMPSGGKLTIGAENVVLDEQYARMHVEAKSGPYVVLTVTDTGSGIPHSIIGRIFEPFFSTKTMGKGTGLGLATVSALVKSHGGFVNVYSEVGKGTTFKVYLPAAGKAEPEKELEERAELPSGKGELVLVVDDETSIRDITKETLEAYGYHAITASDGTEAVAIYAERKGEIDLVLTDMLMPFLDGPATIRALKRIKPNLKIIATSGLADKGRTAEVSESAVEAFLTKPYTAEHLLNILHEVLAVK